MMERFRWVPAVFILVKFWFDGFTTTCGNRRTERFISALAEQKENAFKTIYSAIAYDDMLQIIKEEKDNWIRSCKEYDVSITYIFSLVICNYH